MADNYLEKQYEGYLQRKEAWLKGKTGRKKVRKTLQQKPAKPEDESL